MEKSILIAALALTSVSAFSQEQQPREFEHEIDGVSYTMKQYVFCMYMRGDRRDQSEEEVARIQKMHLSHLGNLEAEHNLVMAGPFGDDTEKRGILVFDLVSTEVAEQAVSEDPAVQAKRLTFECNPIWLAKGTTLP